jgi:hypothetical protein
MPRTAAKTPSLTRLKYKQKKQRSRKLIFPRPWMLSVAAPMVFWGGCGERNLEGEDMFTRGLRPSSQVSAYVTCLVLTTLMVSCGQQDPAFKEDVSTTTRNSGDSKAATRASGDKDGEIEPGLADTETQDLDGGADDSSDGGGIDGTPGSDGVGDTGGEGDAGKDSGSTGGDGIDTKDGKTKGDGDGGMAGDDSGMDSGSEDQIRIVKRTVNAVQKGPGKVDILWIVDSSGSMSEEQTYLGNNFSAFINKLVTAGHDFQTAVTSTDVCQEQIPSDLAQRVCPVNYGGSAATRLRGSFVGDAGRKVLKHTDADIVTRFTNYTKVGINGSGFEHGLKAAQLAVEKVTNGENDSLIRADAFLAVIVVSDEEDDGIGLSMKDPGNGRNFTEEGLTTFKFTEDNMIDYLKTIKGAGKFSVSAIAPTRNADGKLCSAAHSKPNEEGTQYIKAAQKTGGIIQSICETNWNTSLAQIGYDLNAQITQIALPSKPDTATIKVTADGVAIAGWTYNEGNNAVKFNPDSVPAEGAKIQIDYIEAQIQ